MYMYMVIYIYGLYIYGDSEGYLNDLFNSFNILVDSKIFKTENLRQNSNVSFSVTL